MKNRQFTRGNPSPALAQFTLDNVSRSISATGEAILEGGNIPALHVGQVYPAGAVLAGNFWAYWFRQGKWNTSVKHRKKTRQWVWSYILRLLQNALSSVLRLFAECSTLKWGKNLDIQVITEIWNKYGNIFDLNQSKVVDGNEDEWGIIFLISSQK